MASIAGYYDTLKSVAGKVFTYLASITLTGTDGKAITVTENTSLDEAVAMSSKAPKTDVIKGDGTAGRVLRLLKLEIFNGTNVSTIKCQTYNLWHGDVVAQADNIPKNGSSGAFSLSADGKTLIIADSAIAGDVVAALIAHIAINQTTTAFNADLSVLSGIRIQFSSDPNGSDIDITSIIDTGGSTIYIHILYLTSA